MSIVKLALVATLATLAVVALYHHTQTKAQVASEDSLFAEFQAWKAQYNKPYGGAEETRRFNIFKSNKAVIESHNTVNRTYTVGVNQFTDLTSEEFSAIYLGFKVEDANNSNATVAFASDANPTTVDWRGKTVNDVQNQQQCGSCWAFSAIAALEGLQAKTNGKLMKFSEQQLVDCSTTNNGCNGGLMTNAFTHAAVYGLETEDNYKYMGVDGKCKYEALKVVFKNENYKNVAAYDWKALETAVAQQVVSVAIQADATPFQYYTGGVINDVACGTSLDHGVAVVGYTEDAWIVRNSWGPTWGEDGYVRIAKGDQSYGAGICGINKMASYPTA